MGALSPISPLGRSVVEALRRVTDAPLDVHLMIVEPERYIKQFAQAGASTITVHIEATPHLHRVLEQIKEAGCRAGVALESPYARGCAGRSDFHAGCDQCYDRESWLWRAELHPGHHV